MGETVFKIAHDCHGAIEEGGAVIFRDLLNESEDGQVGRLGLPFHKAEEGWDSNVVGDYNVKMYNCVYTGSRQLKVPSASINGGVDM